MKRWFYRDPLAAAWQAKHFGMKFVEAEEDEPFDDWGDFLHWNWDQTNDPSEIDDPLYIHPDSLHLLEPKAGDVVTAKFGVVGAVGNAGHDTPIGIWWAGTEGRKPLSEAERIIQRNGILFHWPESEAA